MTEPVAKAEVRPLAAAGAKPEATVVGWSANLVERSVGIPVGIGRTAREELFRAVYTAIDWAEGVNQSGFKIVREAVHQLDQLSRQAIDGVETVVATFGNTVRGTGEAAGAMVSKTAVSLMGVKEA